MGKVRSQRNISRVSRSLTFFFYLVILVFFGGPLLWLISLSFKTVREVFSFPPTVIPSRFSLEAYLEVWRGDEIIMFLLNSLKLASLSAVGTLVVTVPGAYAFSRFKIGQKRTLLMIILLFQMISPLIISIPLYRYFAKIGLLNSHFGVVVVYISTLIPLITWMLKGFFDSIPISVEESAQVDGCSRIHCLLRITLPMAASGIAASFIFAFLLSWSEFIIPFILLDNMSSLPISVGIYTFQSGRIGLRTNVVAAASVMAILPPVVIFMVLQSYVVKAMTAGAVKG